MGMESSFVPTTWGVPKLRLQPPPFPSKQNNRLRTNYSTTTDNLVPRFALWLTLPAAQFLHGRTVEANWDIDELLSQKDVILAENLLTATLRGYPFNSAESWVKVVQKSLPKEGATDVEK